MYIYISTLPTRKRRSPDLFSHIWPGLSKNLKYSGWRRSHRHRFMQAKDKCSLAIQRVEDRLVRYIPEGLASYLTGDRSVWPLAKGISRDFCPSNFPPIRSPSGSLVCHSFDKTEVLASKFASNFTFCQFCLPTFSCFRPLLLTAGQIRRVISNLSVPKFPVRKLFHPLS